MLAFQLCMIATFIGAFTTMFAGVASMGKSQKDAAKSNRLMFWRVGLCALLLVEIVVYVSYFR